ncbi:MAG: hypothetical protein FGM58_08195, partial [Acidimicrobiia bacterium]|nr:hypothetical protein [Acidimicrobiia bacterium]
MDGGVHRGVGGTAHADRARAGAHGPTDRHGSGAGRVAGGVRRGDPGARWRHHRDRVSERRPLLTPGRVDRPRPGVAGREVLIGAPTPRTASYCPHMLSGPRDSDEGFDVVIVGAGSAGCVLANRLSADPTRRVALLEAGPAPSLTERPVELRRLSLPVSWPWDWQDEVVATGRRHSYGRGRGLGGSSATNGAVALRPEPADCDRWPTGWRWEEFLPTLRDLERDLDFGERPWHGNAGPVPIVRWPESEWNEMQRG